MYPPEQIFIWDYEKLSSIVERPMPATLLEASGIARKLICDSSPLIHLANRNLRLPIRFSVSSFAVNPPPWPDNSPAPLYVGLGGQLLPNPDHPDRVTHLKIDPFLALEVATIDGKSISVRDMIKYFADNAGGVHKDKPTEDNAIKIDSIPSFFLIYHIPVTLMALLPIIKVIKSACEPLYNEILENEKKRMGIVRPG